MRIRARPLGSVWVVLTVPDHGDVRSTLWAAWRHAAATVPAIRAVSADPAAYDDLWYSSRGRTGLAVYHDAVDDQPVYRAEPCP